MANSIFVALNGSDKSAGTSAAPLRTISKAVSKAAAGDKIIVRDGTYKEIVRISKGIEVVAENNRKAVISGLGSAANTDLVTVSADRARLSGFVVRDATRSGIAVWDADDAVLANNSVFACMRSGIWAGGPGLNSSNRIQVTGNVVANTCLENRARNWSGGWPRAIAIDDSNAAVVSQNIVAQNYGEGIGLLSTDGGRIERNVVFDNFSVEVYLDNAPNSKVTGNLLFTSGNVGFYRNSKPAFGVLIANEAEAQFQLPSKGIKVTGNTLIGPANADYVGPDTWAKTVLTDCLLNPNTVLPWMDRSDVLKLISGLTAAPIGDLLPCGSVVRCQGTV